jgi:hypothetical protein
VKCDGNEVVDGNGNKGGGQVMATATKRAMVTAMRVADNKTAMAMVADGDKGVGEQMQ